MNKEADDILAYFRENVTELRKLGKGWGLDDSEIAQCIEQAMSVKPEDLPPASEEIRKKLSAHKSWTKLRFFLFTTGALIVLLAGVLMTVDGNTIEASVSHVTTPLVSPAMRFIRHAAVPLHKWFNLHGRFERF
jgi:hypothetical protein